MDYVWSGNNVQESTTVINSSMNANDNQQQSVQEQQQIDEYKQFQMTIYNHIINLHKEFQYELDRVTREHELQLFKIVYAEESHNRMKRPSSASRRSTNKRELTGVVTDESPATAAATAYSVSKLSPYFVSLTPHLQCHKEGKLFIDCKRSDLKLYNCSSV
ncbi:unnamed protein product [Schistosoma curassoni]|uniref:CACTA en-spm transposon protein n=1 Tax=Schistosoma curassoni TaxID=6186 RepID=A0A183KWK9_9TREM|nr:unnamed protein product [Schistosoma curassoni]